MGGIHAFRGVIVKDSSLVGHRKGWYWPHCVFYYLGRISLDSHGFLCFAWFIELCACCFGASFDGQELLVE